MAGILEDFAPALKEIAKLGSMNNKPFGKYERGSWQLVEDAETRYKDAFWRHLLDGRHEIDPETGMPHDVAIAWNAIALVWMRLKREKKEEQERMAAEEFYAPDAFRSLKLSIQKDTSFEPKGIMSGRLINPIQTPPVCKPYE